MIDNFFPSTKGTVMYLEIVHMLLMVSLLSTFQILQVHIQVLILEYRTR